MSPAVLPAEFRCFHHILHIYARNLPLRSAEADSPAASHCVSSYFTLSHSPVAGCGARGTVYTSEVCRGTQHPEWASLPEEVHGAFAGITRFVFSLYYCASTATSAIPSPATDMLLYEMLMDTTHVQYVAASVTRADALARLPCHIDSGTHPFVVLLRCRDGVFFPLHQGAQMDTRTTCALDAPLLDDAARTRAPSHFGPHALTVGSVKGLAAATLAWRLLTRGAMARREDLQKSIDTCAAHATKPAEAAAQCAVMRLRLCTAGEATERHATELRRLRTHIAAEATALEDTRGAGERAAAEASATVQSAATRQLDRLHARLRLARRQRSAELSALFPLRRALPLPPPPGDPTREHTLAIASAAHCVAVAAVTRGCALPHPPLLAGNRTALLALPHDAETRLPLGCARAADRPAAAAAAELLAADAKALLRGNEQSSEGTGGEGMLADTIAKVLEV